MAFGDTEHAWLLSMASDKLVLRLPAKAKDVIFWLAPVRSNQELVCAAIIGKWGQLIIRPIEALPEAFKLVSSRLDKDRTNFADERSPWFEVARQSAAFGSTRVTVEQSGRASLYLPRVLCVGSLAPGLGEKAVLVVIDAVVEVWTLPAWTTWLKDSAKESEKIERAALDDLCG